MFRISGKPSSVSRRKASAPSRIATPHQLELVSQLAHELSAPVGLIDPSRGIWLVHQGAPADAFPEQLIRLLPSSKTITPAYVWHDESTAGADWLILPVPGFPRPLLAAAGFARATTAERSPTPWGPSCPTPALCAWGQSIADRHFATPAVPNSSDVQAPEPANQIIGRLIRRLRISDPPERFQQLAVNAIRSAMGVQAVAWVPANHYDPIVQSGEIGGLNGHGLRTLMPHNHDPKKSFLVVNQFEASVGYDLKRMVAATAEAQGSLGWLYAFNPLVDRPFSVLDGDLVQTVASSIATQHVNARVYADLKELLFGVIRALTSAIDAKDPYTSGHSERVARIAVRLAEELGMSANQRGDLYLMGLLHDVGKIGVDDAVLKKPGPLSPEEYRQIQAHVEVGVHILTDLKKLHHLLPGVRHHHESLDGTGYPSGLVGNAIPFEARILAVADSYDAMSSTRPYRRRLTPLQIDDILRKGMGKQWDPQIVEALFACRMDLEMIRQKGLGESLQLAVSETLGRN